ncbi:MAG: hypothetical protein HGA37_08410 [Lentimicrobium sp.]|nr:hypothetical protein [Lentimicrobium sp.]
MPENYTTVFSIRLAHQLLSYFLITICLSSCGQRIPDKGHQLQSGNVFAMTEGQISIAGQQTNIARSMWQSKDGHIVVNSALRNFIGDSVDEATTIRYIREYSDGDSIFSYDTSDSSVLVIALSDITNTEISGFPYSAFWLISTGSYTHITDQSDTLTIAGYHCKRFKSGESSVWMHKQQPMAFETTLSQYIRQEKVIKYISDTLLPNDLFKQPPGFRKIAPTND